MKQQESSISKQIGDILDEITQVDVDSKDIYQIDNESLQIKDVDYVLAIDYREGFALEAFKNRYQEYFEKFDFIVGDWGFEQLRLRGFYQLNQRRVPIDQTIGFLDDYLKEYCNFGCRYFVLAKTDSYLQYQKLVKSENGINALNTIKEPFKPTKNNVSTSKTKFKSNRRNRKPQSNQRKTDKPKEAFSIKTQTKKTQSETNKTTSHVKKPKTTVQKKVNSSFIIKNPKSQTNRGT